MKLQNQYPHIYENKIELDFFLAFIIYRDSMDGVNGYQNYSRKTNKKARVVKSFHITFAWKGIVCIGLNTFVVDSDQESIRDFSKSIIVIELIIMND